MKIEDKVARYGWAQTALNQLQAELDEAMRVETDIPVEPGGWWHQYVCPEHHSELLFDPHENDASVFTCPHGCKLEGEPYRGAWLVFKHQAMARRALEAAVVYAATKELRYAEWSRSILERYAQQFPLYPVHPDSQPWMLRGRAFHQALTEASWATTLMRAYLLLRDEGVFDKSGLDEPFRLFFSMLEESVAQAREILVEERQKPESNYTAWLNAELACLYALKQDHVKMREIIEGKAGLRHHLTIGVKPDQMEYEGSVYYHVFVLRAYLIAAEMATRLDFSVYDMQGEQGQSFEGMLDALVLLASGSGELPSLHDGPYERVPYSREIAEILEIGMMRYQKPEYIPLLMAVYRTLNEEGARAGLEALLLGEGDGMVDSKPILKPAVCFEASGFVVGRLESSPLAFYTDFGKHGGSHGHFDKLHLTLELQGEWIAPELGMVPYGSALRKEWYAATASHNTVLVGGKSQQPHEGECVSFQQVDGAVYSWLRSREAFEGCTLNRHLYLTKEWLLDWYVVELEEAAEIDWWMHAPVLTASQPNHWRPDEGVLEEQGAYSYVKRRLTWKGEYGALCQTLLEGERGGRVTMSSLAFPTSALTIVQTPGTSKDPSRSFHGLLHRQTGRMAEFVTVYRAGEEPVDIVWLGTDASGNKAVQLHVAGQTWGCALEVEAGIRVSVV
ncbi:heparinase II/III domain-containing protein [Paenibacillus cremeus]|uniref:Alginate lyase family protein n=1 Tax=Paenibacillus cremeus TaxID=2163881 RepID=A0A559K6N3_9BACL|nr:heparinase II/III family protein [Paenibacillus cremeus]TVY07774.1 alginate lyase family protein [Paenibacillus cremeus]